MMKSSNNKLVFIEHNPFMSIELLDLIKNYRIVCYNNDYTYNLLKDNWDIASYMNTNFTEEPDSDVVVEIILGDKKFVKKAVSDNPNNKILFFYMNSKMDELVKQNNLTTVLPSFELQNRIGSKVYLTEMCNKLNIPQNDYLVFKKIPSNINSLFNKCKGKLGLPFIIQGGQGESGWDVSLIHNESELIEALKKTQQGLRISKYLSRNIPLSAHVNILRDKIIIYGPYLQLIGFNELSAGPFRFGGNDTKQKLIKLEVIKSINNYTKLISEFAKSEGYSGILGIDYLWDLNSDLVYPQEINSRLVGLTRLLTGIQKDNNCLPDLVSHIQEFTDIELTDKGSKLDKTKLKDLKSDYSQIIVRHNKQEKILVSNRIEPGIYKIVNGEMQMSKNSLFLENLDIDEFLITSSAHKGCTISTNEAIVRMLLKRSVTLDNEYKLHPEIINIVNKIREYTTK
jgi:hypothetical protein